MSGMGGSGEDGYDKWWEQWRNHTSNEEDSGGTPADTPVDTPTEDSTSAPTYTPSPYQQELASGSAHQQKLAALLASFGNDMSPVVNEQLNRGYGQQLQAQGLPMYGEQPPYTPPANDPVADPGEGDELRDGVWGSRRNESYYDRMWRKQQERMLRGRQADVMFGNTPDRR